MELKSTPFIGHSLTFRRPTLSYYGSFIHAVNKSPTLDLFVGATLYLGASRKGKSHIYPSQLRGEKKNLNSIWNYLSFQKIWEIKYPILKKWYMVKKTKNYESKEIYTNLLRICISLNSKSQFLMLKCVDF